MTSLQSFNLSFPLLFHVICIAILKFLPWFLASPPWFPTFFVFPTRFPTFPRWFSAPAFPSHSSHSHPYFMQFPYSSLQFPILAFTYNLLSFLLLHNSWHQIIISIIYDVISAITKNYLPYSTSATKSIFCAKCEQIILSGWGVTYVLRQRKAQPARNYEFFGNL